MYKINYTGRKHERNKSDRGCVMCVIQMKNKRGKISKYKI